MSTVRRTTTAEVHGSGSPTIEDIRAAIDGLPPKGVFSFSKLSDQRETSWKIIVTWNQEDEKRPPTTGPFHTYGQGVRSGEGAQAGSFESTR